MISGKHKERAADLSNDHSVVSPIDTMQYAVDGEMNALKSKNTGLSEATLNAVRISFPRFFLRKSPMSKCYECFCAPNVCANGDHCNCVPK